MKYKCTNGLFALFVVVHLLKMRVMVGFNKIEKDDLKTGNRLKAHWDGAYHEITKIEKGIVHYKGITYIGNWTDKISVMLECFDLVEL